jgi:hypothetical protein
MEAFTKESVLKDMNIELPSSLLKVCLCITLKTKPQFYSSMNECRFIGYIFTIGESFYTTHSVHQQLKKQSNSCMDGDVVRGLNLATRLLWSDWR